MYDIYFLLNEYFLLFVVRFIDYRISIDSVMFKEPKKVMWFLFIRSNCKSHKKITVPKGKLLFVPSLGAIKYANINSHGLDIYWELL